MHIGIIIHSQSGHTASLAKSIAGKFRQNGHEADVVLLLTSGLAKPGSRRFTISNAPNNTEIARFDAVLFGGPVWGFRASPVITRYIASLGRLQGKKTMSFVTMCLPLKSLGASRAISRMNRLLETVGGTVVPGEALRYFFGFRQQALASALDQIYGRIAPS